MTPKRQKVNGASSSSLGLFVWHQIIEEIDISSSISFSANYILYADKRYPHARIVRARTENRPIAHILKSLKRNVKNDGKILIGIKNDLALLKTFEEFFF